MLWCNRIRSVLVGCGFLMVSCGLKWLMVVFVLLMVFFGGFLVVLGDSLSVRQTLCFGWLHSGLLYCLSSLYLSLAHHHSTLLKSFVSGNNCFCSYIHLISFIIILYIQQLVSTLWKGIFYAITTQLFSVHRSWTRTLHPDQLAVSSAGLNLQQLMASIQPTQHSAVPPQAPDSSSLPGPTPIHWYFSPSTDASSRDAAFSATVPFCPILWPVTTLSECSYLPESTVAPQGHPQLSRCLCNVPTFLLQNLEWNLQAKSSGSLALRLQHSPKHPICACGVVEPGAQQLPTCFSCQ